jgi:hypothetical protein
MTEGLFGKPEIVIKRSESDSLPGSNVAPEITSVRW